MTALSNTRLNTITRDFDWRDMDYEVQTVAALSEVSGQYGVTLQDHLHNVTVGRKRTSGLAISSISNPAGTTFRYNFSGSPDLSTVVVGDYLHVKSATTAANNGRFLITGVSDGSDYIEVTNASGVVQAGAAGECAVSYDVRTQSSLDDAPTAGQFNADTRYGTGRVVHPSGDSGIDFVYQYEGAGSISSISRMESIASEAAESTSVSAGRPYGMVLSNNGTDPTNDIDISAGRRVSNAGTAILEVVTALTKRLDATYSSGTGNGMRSSSLSWADGSWHIFVVKIGATTDYIADTDPDCANGIIDHGVEEYKRIGGIIRSGGSILAFDQFGDEFILATAVADIAANNPGTSAVTRTMTVLNGVQVYAIMDVGLNNAGAGGTTYGLITGLDESDVAASATRNNMGGQNASAGFSSRSGSRMTVRTNTSGQVRSRISYSDADVTLYMTAIGWHDVGVTQ